MGGAIAFGYMSFKMRRIRVGSLESNLAPRDAELPISILNDFMMAVFGYVCGHLLSCDYIYKHRQYILQRLYLEDSQKISDRTKFLINGKMLEEYPLLYTGILADSYIIE